MTRVSFVSEDGESGLRSRVFRPGRYPGGPLEGFQDYGPQGRSLTLNRRVPHRASLQNFGDVSSYVSSEVWGQVPGHLQARPLASQGSRRLESANVDFGGTLFPEGRGGRRESVKGVSDPSDSGVHRSDRGPEVHREKGPGVDRVPRARGGRTSPSDGTSFFPLPTGGDSGREGRRSGGEWRTSTLRGGGVHQRGWG